MAYVAQDGPHQGSQGARSRQGLVPGVTELGATYDPTKQILTLSGIGKTNFIVYGFEFIYDKHFVGGLRFFFKCRLGPVVRFPTSYEWSQSFEFGHDPVHFPMASVLICDADHPQGVEVEVKWLGLKPKSLPKPVATEAVQAAAATPTAVYIPQPITMNVLYQETMEISVDAKLSGVKIDFDPEFLRLQQASITEDGKMAWIFFTIRMGRTTVTVDYGSQSPLLGSTRIYYVNIALPFGPPAVINKQSDKASDAVLSFVGGVNIAVRKVRAQWPEAALYRVDCERPKGGPVYPVNSPYAISNLTAYFIDGNKGSIKISSLGWWSTWDTPKYEKFIITGSQNIPWPPSEKDWELGLEDAVEKLLQAPDVPPTFWSCKLFYPLYPEIEQPQYSFDMIDTSTWSVGAKDGKVWKEETPVQIASEYGVNRWSYPPEGCSIQ